MNLKNKILLLLILATGLLISNQAKAFYNPQTGRWLSRDTIREGSGLNAYVIVANSPIASVARSRIILRPTPFFPITNFYALNKFSYKPSLTVANPCLGGPLQFDVHFVVDFDDQGSAQATLAQGNATFSYDGATSPLSNYQSLRQTQPAQMIWDNLYSKNLPHCPIGRQSGESTFIASGIGDSQTSGGLTIYFFWHYECDCSCKEKEPFKASYATFFRAVD